MYYWQNKLEAMPVAPVDKRLQEEVVE